MSWKYSQDILHRKLAYLQTLASVDGIDTSMERWISLLSDIQLEISYDVIYRLLEELYLMIYCGFDWSDFDFPPLPIDFDFPEILDPPLQGGDKAYYDVSYYDVSYYDPPDIAFRDLERFTWSNRYRVTEKDTTAYKKQSASLKKLLAARGTGVAEAGVAPHMLDVIQDVLAMVESRLLGGMYCGFGIVGLSKVSDRHQEAYLFRARVNVRLPQDWKSTTNAESVVACENIVGVTRVDHTRVGAYTTILNKGISDEAVRRINEFWLRSGLVEVGMLSPYGGIGYGTYGVPAYGGYVAQRIRTLYPRIFMLQRVDQYHYKGGAEQLKMQFNIKRVRKLLDKHGIISSFRGGYYAFANEVYYLGYDSHKLYKLWRRLVTQDDILQKYVKLGCQENVLREVMGVVKP